MISFLCVVLINEDGNFWCISEPNKHDKFWFGSDPSEMFQNLFFFNYSKKKLSISGLSNRPS